eukprot:587989-Rhodomonas_salina.4
MARRLYQNAAAHSLKGSIDDVKVHKRALEPRHGRCAVLTRQRLAGKSRPWCRLDPRSTAKLAKSNRNRDTYHYNVYGDSLS